MVKTASKSRLFQRISTLNSKLFEAEKYTGDLCSSEEARWNGFVRLNFLSIIWSEILINNEAEPAGMAESQAVHGHDKRMGCYGIWCDDVCDICVWSG